MTEILNTQNKDRGFWGTTNNILQSTEKTKEAWEIAFTLIYDITGLEKEQIRAFLDSRWGNYIANEFQKALRDDTFKTTFPEKVSKKRLLREYHYYVDATTHGHQYPKKHIQFCNDLEKLSRKYGIVLEVVGGVIFSTNGFMGYIPHLSQGDLLARWQIK